MSTVVLTRPQGKNEALAALLKERGISSLLLPALCVRPTMSRLPAQYWPLQFDLLVFVSAQAAQYYLDALAAAGQRFAPHQRIATVGAASALPFYEAGLAEQVQLIHPPATHPYQDSEALWELLEPQLAEVNRVLLVRGQQGREWLSDKLLAAHKTLSRCCIYERLPAEWSSQEIGCLQQALAQPKMVTMLLTSSESTQAIYTAIHRLGLMQAWLEIHFVAIHPRIGAFLQELTALSNTQMAAQVTLCTPSQPAMLEALLSVAMPTNA